METSGGGGGRGEAATKGLAVGSNLLNLFSEFAYICFPVRPPKYKFTNEKQGVYKTTMLFIVWYVGYAKTCVLVEILPNASRSSLQVMPVTSMAGIARSS